MTTTDPLADAQALYAAATADIPGTLSDEEIDRLVHERTVAERTFMMQAAPELLAEVKQQRADLEQFRRGGQELGKVVDFMGGLIKDAFLRGADDPIGALHMLGDYLAEITADEGGLSVEEHNRVYRALDARRVEAERLKAERAASERAVVAAIVKRDSETTT